MKYKLLIITEKYLDNTNPISQCVKLLTNALTKININIDIVCFGERDCCLNRNNINIYVIKYLDYNSNIIVRFFNRLFHWPVETNIDINKINTLVNYLCSKNHYDGLISVHCTFISVLIGIISKIKIKKILYILDPIGAKIESYYKGFKKVLFPIIKLKELIAYYKFDFIVMMKCHYGKYKNYCFGLFDKKIRYYDFPLLSKVLIGSCDNSKDRFDNRKKNDSFIIYGTVLKKTRSPKYCIDLLNLLYNGYLLDFELFTYIHGDAVEFFDDRSIHFKYINHGIIDQSELNNKILYIDYIINIGNSILDMLPSKIFQMFMTGKPIIHFAKSKDDCCNEYMERYGNALIIYEEDDLDYSLNRLLEFLKDYKIVPIEKVKEIFKENIPEYQANLIKELVLDNKINNNKLI